VAKTKIGQKWSKQKLVKTESGQKLKSKRKVFKTESGPNSKWSKLEVVKTESGQN
jgi:hypothetical protein